MKKLFLSIAVIIFVFFSAFKSAGNLFPELTGKTLDNKNITVPKDTKGKFTLLAIVYSNKAQEDLDSWLEPLYRSFAGNPMFKVNMYLVPMIDAIKLSSNENIEKKLKANIDPALHPYVLIYPGKVDKFKKELNMSEKDKPYFFVIDPNGEIVYQTSGKYSEKKLDEIADHMSE